MKVALDKLVTALINNKAYLFLSSKNQMYSSIADSGCFDRVGANKLQ